MRILFLSIVVLSCFSCTRANEEEVLDCSLVYCAPAQGVFYIKIIDKLTGENLIANGRFDTTGVSVQNGALEKLPVFPTGIADSLKNTINFSDYSKPGANTVKIITKQETLSFSYNFSYEKRGCCGAGDVEKIEVKDLPFNVYSVNDLWKNLKVIEIKL